MEGGGRTGTVQGQVEVGEIPARDAGPVETVKAPVDVASGVTTAGPLKNFGLFQLRLGSTRRAGIAAEDAANVHAELRVVAGAADSQRDDGSSVPAKQRIDDL